MKKGYILGSSVSGSSLLRPCEQNLHHFDLFFRLSGAFNLLPFQKGRYSNLIALVVLSVPVLGSFCILVVPLFYHCSFPCDPSCSSIKCFMIAAALSSKQHSAALSVVHDLVVAILVVVLNRHCSPWDSVSICGYTSWKFISIGRQ